jgi:hypothetical protein
MKTKQKRLEGAKRQTTFEPNEWLETLLRIQRDEPQRFAKLSPSLRISVGIYAEQKAKAYESKNRAA